MPRTILTFINLHQLLSAEKRLRERRDAHLKLRTTPTPPGLSASICGMSLELLQPDQLPEILQYLKADKLEPEAVHELDA